MQNEVPIWDSFQGRKFASVTKLTTFIILCSTRGPLGQSHQIALLVKGVLLLTTWLKYDYLAWVSILKISNLILNRTSSDLLSISKMSNISTRQIGRTRSAWCSKKWRGNPPKGVVWILFMIKVTAWYIWPQQYPRQGAPTKVRKPKCGWKHRRSVCVWSLRNCPLIHCDDSSTYVVTLLLRNYGLSKGPNIPGFTALNTPP